MNLAELIGILRCPETMQPVREATADELAACNLRIAAGEIRTQSGVLRAEPVSGGLLRADGRLLFTVENRIPVMLIEEALVLT